MKKRLSLTDIAIHRNGIEKSKSKMIKGGYEPITSVEDQRILSELAALDVKQASDVPITKSDFGEIHPWPPEK